MTAAGLLRARGHTGRFVASPPVERFWARVSKDASGCWLWIGALSVQGYGVFCPSREVQLSAHRFSHQIHGGRRVPKGLTIDHLCRVPRCVNPAHLEVVTYAENNRRMWEANRRTHCKRGHAYTPDNTMQSQRGRACRECHRRRGRESARRRRVAAREAARAQTRMVAG